MTIKRSHIAAVMLSAVLMLAAPQLVAGDTENDQELALQQDEAREAVKQGLIRPLEDILARVRQTVTGDIVEIEFEKDDGRYIYEIEYVRPDGHLMEIKIDARTLDVLAIDEDD